MSTTNIFLHNDMQPGARIVAPAQFSSTSFIELSNNYITYIDKAMYPSLANIGMPEVNLSELEQEINNPSPVSFDYFGYSVSINSTGDRIVVGAHYDDTGADDAGSVYVYTRSGTTWTLEQEINNPSPVFNDYFGWSVAIDSAGDRIVVGAYQEDTGASAAGSVYIYTRSGTVWTLEQEINNPSPVADDYFGWSVAIDSTGDRIVVGAYWEDTGASAAGSVYVYSRVSTTWSLEQEINNPSPVAFDVFGVFVSINSTGDRIVVGAPLDDTSAGEAGSVYVYSRSGTTWTLEQEINNPSPVAGDNFGTSVAIDSTGDRIVVSAYFDDTGADDAGSVYVYSRSGTTWTLEQEINNPTPVASDNFGVSVSINSTGDRIVVGAHYEDTGAGEAGSVYIYTRSGTTWTLEQEINNPSPVASDYFGVSVSIDSTGDRIVVGAYGEDTGAGSAGSVYVYSSESSTSSVIAIPPQNLPLETRSFIKL